MGISKTSFIGGGGRPTISGSLGIIGASIEGSMGASWLGAERGTLGGAGAGLGLLNMLAQLRVPSGFELGCACSFGGERVASAEEMFSHPESKGVLSATAESQLGVAVSTAAGVSHEAVPGSTAAGVSHGAFSVPETSSVLTMPLVPLAKPPLPPRVAVRPRSDPRPRPPRVLSKPPRPRPPRVDALVPSEAALAGSLAFD